jgi:DNA repair exonuclease SbcCD ATPase subunit
MMKRCFYFVTSLFLALPLQAEVIDIQKELKSLQSQSKALEGELLEIQSSLLSLEQAQEVLTSELNRFEAGLSTELNRSIVPLMAWPPRKISTRTKTWVAHQRSQFLVDEVRRNLIREPLLLVNERERRIKEILKLREEMSQKLSELQIKRSLLDFQVEELELIRRRSRTALPQASGRTKRSP